MGLVATSFYTLSKHISIFRRFHLSYKAQKEKKPLLSQDRFLAKIAIVFSARHIPAVFLINSAPWSMRRQNASMLLTCKNFPNAGFLFIGIFKVEKVFVISLPHFIPSCTRAYDSSLCNKVVQVLVFSIKLDHSCISFSMSYFDQSTTLPT